MRVAGLALSHAFGCLFLALAAQLIVPPTCLAYVLSLEQALTDASSSSFDTRIARMRAYQLRADIKALRADFYPSLIASTTNEYVKGLNNSTQPVFSVGNSTFNAVTRVQALASLQANWTLFDFGARKSALRSAHRSYEAALMVPSSTLRDLRISVIDVYGRALTIYKELRSKEIQVPVYRELFELKQKTFVAGTTSRVELGEQAVQLAQAEDGVKHLREELTQCLRELSSLTHVTYFLDDLEMVDIEDEVVTAIAFEPKQTPDYKQFEKQIQAKEAELKAIKAQRYPQIRAYGGYVLYGTDKNNLGGAIGDFNARLLNAGVTLQWTVFDGFKNSAQCERKRYEIKELQAQRDKRLWELRSQYETATASLAPLAAELSTKAEIVTRGKQKVEMFERLADQKMTDRTSVLTQQAQLIQQQFAGDRVRIQQSTAKEKIKVMAQL